MNKWKVEKIGRSFLAVCLIAGIVVGLMGSMITHAEDSYYYDEAKVYDMSELSKGKKEEIISGNYANSLGELPTTENVAVSFNMTKPTSLNWNVKHCFLNTTGMSYNNAGGYYIYYHYQGSNEIRIESLDGTGSYSKVAYDWNQGTSKQVEVGSVNVYSDAEKQSQVAKKVYVKIDGTVVLEHMDTTFANATYGKYVSVPVVDGNFGTNSGRVRTNYSFDTVTVYDMDYLSEGKSEANILTTYSANSLGAFSSTDNVSVMFNLTMPGGTSGGKAWNVKQGFLNTAGNSWDSNGYLIYFRKGGADTICITDVKESVSRELAYAFAVGSTKKVELGAVNVYSDASKTTKIGRQIYIKLDGNLELSYVDKTISTGDVGKNVAVPVLDAGNTGGKITKVIQSYDNANVYDMSELSEGKNEEIISSDYTNSLGNLPTSENVAVRFKMTKPTGLNWNAKQCFLNTTGQNYSSAGGYYIYYHYQGNNVIRIDSLDGSGRYRSVAYTFSGEQIVELGSVNVYSDTEKQMKIGKEIYVKIGDNVVRFLETNDIAIGSGVSVPVVDGNFTANSGCIKTTHDDWNVARYRGSESYTYPTKVGYVFAGWYTDKDYKTPLATNVKTGRAYAKFVEQSVLSVKCQLPIEASTSDPTTNLRVLTSVDTLDYVSVALTVKFGDVRTFATESKTVYRQITAIDKQMEAYSYDAKTAFENNVSEYFMAYTITGIPLEVFEEKVTVTPSWTTLDGTVVTGVINEFTIKEAIEKYCINNN